YIGVAEATLRVSRPFAYLIPPTWTKVLENLQRHGIAVEELREDIELDVEVYRIDKSRPAALYQKRQMMAVEATARKESKRVPAGSILVRTAQPLGTLAAFLLEPQADDGLCVWGFFEGALKEGQDYPVLRLPAKVPLTAGPVRPLAEERTLNKRITIDMVLGATGRGRGRGRGPNLSGTPLRDVTWLEDGEHFLQHKEGQLLKVNAVTGRSRPQPTWDANKIAKAVSALPGLDQKAKEAVRERAAAEPAGGKKQGDFFRHGDDLYYFAADGGKAVRLTRSPGAKELVTFSPDGRYVAFVRAGNLYTVDVATQTERALTTDGSALVLNGKMDWVYGEEIGHRGGQAYWWSPGSTHLAFVRYDDAPVHKFTVVDHAPTRLNVEVTPYPKSGDPIPLVKLGVVPVAGGPVTWVDLQGYSDGSMILTRAGWLPGGEKLFFYVQDRAQTWLDFCTAPRDGGAPARLFRDKTQAWVDDPGAPHFLKDGSFLLPSERTGWKHLYHFEKDGKLRRALTNGPYEVRTVHLVDEAGGWVYFSGTKDSPIGSNLYRVKLDGGSVERLTQGPGDHRVSVSPKANLFVDYHSSHREPQTARLFRADGTPARTLDTNPVYAREEYALGALELVRIKAPDGVELEASVLRPPGFDPSKRYPVWFMTYGGPHAPTLRDSWPFGLRGQGLRDQALASLGFIVFRADPRCASGKGACSTWTAYRQLGVQELADVETAIRWLNAQPGVDASRVGMSGHSYGGFLTSYALTHSKLFAAGVAGAPVTDWRNYDAFYTERYMNTPQENPQGYDRTSVVKAAAKLHGKLLLIHGVRDDNVHVQNTLQLVQALQRADKDFEVMFYPDSRHGIRGRHYQRLVIDFMRRTLKP
ncbi:MAG TPA: S9 family peptidase, partial [Gemmataceae bacterium]|nr:S9 family peptidase [Gemmataceae bacterium]